MSESVRSDCIWSHRFPMDSTLYMTDLLTSRTVQIKQKLQQNISTIQFSYLLGVEAELGLDGFEVSGAQGSAVDTVRASLAGALANHRADLLAMKREGEKEQGGKITEKKGAEGLHIKRYTST